MKITNKSWIWKKKAEQMGEWKEPFEKKYL